VRMFFEAAELPADGEAAPAGVLLWRDRAAAGSASASPNRREPRALIAGVSAGP
jgi:hypothetical protein